MAAFGTVALAPAASAHTQPQPRADGIVCTTSTQVKFSPAEGTLPGSDSWTATTSAIDCVGVSLDGDPAEPVSATASGTETGECTGAVTGSNGTATVTWDDGTTGTVSMHELTIDRVLGNGPGTFTGTVTGGAHHVGAAVEITGELNDPAGCPDPGGSFPGAFTLL